MTTGSITLTHPVVVGIKIEKQYEICVSVRGTEGADTASGAAHHLISLIGLGKTLDKGDPLRCLHSQKWAEEGQSCTTMAEGQKFLNPVCPRILAQL